VVLSASHNPFQDNGIKIFSSEGSKFPDAWEDEIETRLAGPDRRAQAHGGRRWDVSFTTIAPEADSYIAKVRPDLPF
jgi:phosphomannomutase